MSLSKILIIDDEPLIVKSTSMILKYNNFDVVTAANGIEGLQIAHTSEPDLILLDIMMPGMNGWEVLHQLKDSSTTCHIPVLVFTAKECSIEEREQCSSFVCAFITKPFDPLQLSGQIKQFIRK